jgi:hypothetical protein
MGNHQDSRRPKLKNQRKFHPNDAGNITIFKEETLEDHVNNPTAV